MLEALRSWNEGGAPLAAPRDEESAAERREGERSPMPGAELYLFLENDVRCRLKVRDLGCTGLSGLTDTPLQTGQMIVVQLEEMLMPSAEVIWTRRFMVGFHFVTPLPGAKLQRIRERHEAGAAWSPAMRAGSDMHSWWTNVEEQQSDRRPKLAAGGHRKPLPR